MDFDVNTAGFDDAIEELRELERDLTGGDRWIVGSRVGYAIYVEFRNPAHGRATIFSSGGC